MTEEKPADLTKDEPVDPNKGDPAGPKTDEPNEYRPGGPNKEASGAALPELRDDLPSYPAPDDLARRTSYSLDDRDKKLALYLESRIERRVVNIIRQESGDSYAGLPADHVLLNLHQQFPDVNFPERMMVRLEEEQRGRLEHEKRQDEIERYEAETRRLDAAEDRGLMDRAANRAFLVLAVLLSVAVLLTLLGHPTVGGVLVGGTLIAVIGAFLRQKPKEEQ